jgi:hypothetical protein
MKRQFLRFVGTDTAPDLELACEPIALSGHDVEMVTGQLPPECVDASHGLFAAAFNAIAVHG